MKKSVVMPQMGMTMREGTICKWLAQEGSVVKKGFPLLEVEIDKGIVEIECPATGTLTRKLKREGEVVLVGQAIGWIEEA